MESYETDKEFQPDWNVLQSLRSGFLTLTAGNKDYWNTFHYAEQYDRIFAERIGWKWDAMLEQTRWWSPPHSPENSLLIDIGCGTGIATRKMLQHFGTDYWQHIHLFDRSATVLEYAKKRIQQIFPKAPPITLHTTIPTTEVFSIASVVVVSHIITEIDPVFARILVESLSKAQSVVWVESATQTSSRRLSILRDKLMRDFHICSPCTHTLPCGMLNAVNQRHWCHFHAVPPADAFTNPLWSYVARKLHINLSDLPYSYLVAEKHSLQNPEDSTAPHDRVKMPYSLRVLAAPHCTNRDAVVVTCSQDGIKEYIVSKKHHKELYSSLEKGRLNGMCVSPDIFSENTE